VAGQVQLDLAGRRAVVEIVGEALEIGIDQHAMTHVGETRARLGQPVALDLGDAGVARAVRVGAVTGHDGSRSAVGR
jgi:hypothetical protein